MKNTNKSLINKLLIQIDENLEYVDIYEIVEQSGFSYFHFHRIFQAYMGESLKQYIKRRRLEVSAHKLNYMKLSITQVAMEAGYNTPSAYNKAFKDFFAVSPSEYKKQKLKLQEYEMINPIEVKDIENIDVYFMRHIGDYFKIDKKFEALTEFAFNNNLLNDTVKFYGLYYDDPTVTAEEKLRSEACITMIKDFDSLPQEIEKKQIKGGKHAVFLHEGPYETLLETYQQIFSTYVKENELELSNEPCFEEYLNSLSEEIKPEDLKTLIYIPIK